MTIWTRWQDEKYRGRGEEKEALMQVRVWTPVTPEKTGGLGVCFEHVVPLEWGKEADSASKYSSVGNR